jgi:Flp pilus assembly CpaF family ATPase
MCRRIEKVRGGLFEGEEAVLHVIERIVAPLGLRVDEASPWVDARLSDGSRVQTNFLNAHFRASTTCPDARTPLGYPPTTW